jgi:hypothetical protein
MDSRLGARALLIALVALLCGCGGTRSVAGLPSAPGAGTQAQARSAGQDAVTLTVRPKFMFLPGPGSQGYIYVTYTGHGELHAVTSSPKGMPVHKFRPVPRPKRFIVTQACFCAATITVKDDLGNSASMGVQGT